MFCTYGTIKVNLEQTGLGQLLIKENETRNYVHSQSSRSGVNREVKERQPPSGCSDDHPRIKKKRCPLLNKQ